MKNSDSRKSSRVKLDVFVGKTTGGKYFVPLASDLSEDGILLEFPRGLDMPFCGDSIIEMSLPGIKHLVWARCKLLRREQGGFFERRALRFINISPADRQKIRYFITRRSGLA